MKRFLYPTLMSMLILASCQKDEFQKGTANDLSPFAKSYLGLRTSSNAASLSASAAPVNKSYNDAVGPVASGPVGSVAADTTIISQPWGDCGKYVEIKNADGSTTMITDYGTGCTNGTGDYRYTMWGKITSTYKNFSERIGSLVRFKYFSSNRIENYGGRYYYGQDSSDWNNNGHSTYSGESSYDTANLHYSGSYSYSDTTEYRWGNNTYVYRGHGQSSYSQNGSLVSVSDYYYQTGDEYYQSTVVMPLYTNYKCNMFSARVSFCAMFMYVSGREVIHYRKDGKEGSFEIDYGNGECDTIITIIENGKVIDVDQPTVISLAAKTM